MVFAVIGILSNISKTVLLFMLPQIFNFLYSCPQLFKFVDCPRHRMPDRSAKGDTIEYSRFLFKPSNSKREAIGKIMISILEKLRLAKITRNEKGTWVDCNNLTLMNLILLKFGPMNEGNLAWSVCLVQLMGSLTAYFIRYGLVHIVYNK